LPPKKLEEQEGRIEMAQPEKSPDQKKSYEEQVDEFFKSKKKYWAESRAGIDQAQQTAKQNESWDYGPLTWISPVYTGIGELWDIIETVYRRADEGEEALGILESVLGVRMKDNKKLFKERAKELRDIYSELRRERETLK
jgi:hypothetical protein